METSTPMKADSEVARELAGLASGQAGLALIGHVQVGIEAQIGSLSVSVEQLLALKRGDELRLHETLEAPVTLLLNGRAIATAELVAVDEHYGVRILELL